MKLHDIVATKVFLVSHHKTMNSKSTIRNKCYCVVYHRSVIRLLIDATVDVQFSGGCLSRDYEHPHLLFDTSYSLQTLSPSCLTLSNPSLTS